MNRDTTIEQHMGLVAAVANGLCGHMTTPQLRQELISEGYLKLIGVVDGYQASCGKPLATCIAVQVRYRLIDYLRHLTFLRIDLLTPAMELGLPGLRCGNNGPNRIDIADRRAVLARGLATLSPRQADVMRCTLADESVSETGHGLHMAEATVVSHRVNAMRKLRAVVPS